MLKQKLLYTKLAAFASNDPGRPIFNLLYFTGEEVVATDIHWLAVAKGYQTEEHFETKDGTPEKKLGEYPDWKRLVPEDKEMSFIHTYKEDVMTKTTHAKRMKQVVSALVKATKMPKGRMEVSCLKKHGDGLYFLTADPDFQLKARILTGLSEQSDFKFYSNPRELLKALDLIDASEPDSLTIKVDRKWQRIFFETEDVFIIGSGLLLSGNTASEYQDFRNYVDGEFPARVEATQTDDDYSFLD